MQAALEKAEMENPFKTPEDEKVNTETIINKSVTGIETPLDTITIALQDKRERN